LFNYLPCSCKPARYHADEVNAIGLSSQGKFIFPLALKVFGKHEFAKESIDFDLEFGRIVNTVKFQ
jgi:hypothetical protein